MQIDDVFPTYLFHEQSKHTHKLTVLLTTEVDPLVPPPFREDFSRDGQVQTPKHIFVSAKEALKFQVSSDVDVTFSKGVEGLANYHGIASSLLASAYTFCKKEKKTNSVSVAVEKQGKDIHFILRLVAGKIRSQEWANGRGDRFGTPDYFANQAEKIASEHGLSLTTIRGEELLQNGCRLHHAVGRASVNPPILVNLSYRGDEDSERWTAFVGKGICFDTGGLQRKQNMGIRSMFLDKHGACSCLGAFEQIVKGKPKINLTISLALAENSISENAFRPSDIIKSRRGYTVEIAFTDAEGRLVLADAMDWTQEKYKVQRMIELSTLTYANMLALGHTLAGFYGNDERLLKLIVEAGKRVQEKGWIMPVTEDHHELLASKVADFSNYSWTPPGGCSAAAFLEKFVNEGVSWVHVDMLGVGISGETGTGWGARLLIELVRSLTCS